MFLKYIINYCVTHRKISFI